jgi:CheY-like chemotaxis protein
MLERVTKIDLVLIDFAKPGMSGAEVPPRVQAKRPAIPILFVTGFADRAALAGVSEAHIIGKPFIGSELAEKVGSHCAAKSVPTWYACCAESPPEWDEAL